MDTIRKLLSLTAPGEAAIAKENPFENFTLRDEIILHSSFCNAVRLISSAHQKYRTTKVVEWHTITGQSGSGKTTLINYYHSHFPSVETREKRISPVIVVNTPGSPSVKDLSEAILASLGDPNPTSGAPSNKRSRILVLLKKCEVELILMDEFQHFADTGRVKVAANAAEWLKVLCNEAKLPVIFFGLPRCVRVAAINNQLKRRCGAPFYLAPFLFESEVDKKKFRGILKSFDKLLPVRSSPPLHEANLAKAFYFASNGLLDYVIKIIDDAVWMAGQRTLSVINPLVFAQAFHNKVWSGAPKNLNPFLEGSEHRSLIRPGEPFAGWDDPAQYTELGLSQDYLSNALQS